MAKQRQVKMQQRIGTLGAIQQLESRTDEQLLSESKHRAAARAILGARAAERYDAKASRQYFNEALAGAHPQERPALRQDRKSTRLNSSHLVISYAVFCLKKKND